MPANIWLEIIGWISTALFLISILLPSRIHLHALGVATAISTGIYAYGHEATAIWVKWLIAFVFHGFMWLKLSRNENLRNKPEPTDQPAVGVGR